MKEISKKISVIIMVFVVSSFIGWLYETVITSIQRGRFVDRGVLYLPLCPIYGFGALLILLLFGRLKNGVAAFLTGMLTTTVVELAASYLLEYFWKVKLWSYAGWPLQFDERISLISSIFFGLLSVLLIKWIHPTSQKWMDKLSFGKRIILCVVIVGTLIIDTMRSIMWL